MAQGKDSGNWVRERSIWVELCPPYVLPLRSTLGAVPVVVLSVSQVLECSTLEGIRSAPNLKPGQRSLNGTQKAVAEGQKWGFGNMIDCEAASGYQISHRSLW